VERAGLAGGDWRLFHDSNGACVPALEKQQNQTKGVLQEARASAEPLQKKGNRMARNDEKESDGLAGDDNALAKFARAINGPRSAAPGEGGLDIEFPTRMRNLRRAMIEQFEFEFMRLMNAVQLKETIQKSDVEGLTVVLGKALGELAAQNRSIISEEMAIREKATRCSLNLD